jgi:repressor LexA
MKKQITPRQKQLLMVLYDYIANSGYPPTFEEMRQGLGVSSNQSIKDLLEKLKQGGFIRKGESQARGITILPLGYEELGQRLLAPFVGATSAGVPVQAVSFDGEWMQVPATHYDTKIERLKANVYVLRVYGDSMINAGINDGDHVLVQEKKEFVSGDIVLAYDNDEATIKRFMAVDEPPYLYLKPENPKYDIILFRDSISMAGKVMAVLKSRQWIPVL